VKIALDPYTVRKTPLPDLPRVVSNLGHRHIDLSPRDDFIPFFGHPRVSAAAVHGRRGRGRPFR
jgi:myo-inositol catabolism protein IolH